MADNSIHRVLSRLAKPYPLVNTLSIVSGRNVEWKGLLLLCNMIGLGLIRRRLIMDFLSMMIICSWNVCALCCLFVGGMGGGVGIPYGNRGVRVRDLSSSLTTPYLHPHPHPSALATVAEVARCD